MAEIICRTFLLAFFLYGVTSTVNDRYYPRYHLAPLHGWMNDPNGFSIFRGEYHLFYQFNPNSSQEPGIAHWGHAKSRDLFHWEHLPIAMYPEEWYEKQGVFSGSAIVENDKMYIFYTGNVNHPNEQPDHEQHQALAVSYDGVNIEKYVDNPIINGSEHQPDFRDPKVWKHKDDYYMVLGNSYENRTLGRALIYTSKDLLSWEQVSVIEKTDEYLGYMWECPDFFELDGRFVLLFSPQGIKPEGDKYKNLYQTGYIVGNYDYNTHKFTPLTKFQELDHGHDFYATQSIIDSSGRRIVIAWFDMWEEDYPERADGFTGLMTIPRKLSLTADNKLIQKPVREIALAKGRKLFAGKARSGHTIVLEDKTGEILIKASNNDFQVHIEAKNSHVEISYSHSNRTVTLDRGGEDAIRRTKWEPFGDKIQLRIFIDASSIELFCGGGEVTFSSRFFPDSPITVRLGDNSSAEKLIVNAIKRTVITGATQ